MRLSICVSFSFSCILQSLDTIVVNMRTVFTLQERYLNFSYTVIDQNCFLQVFVDCFVAIYPGIFILLASPYLPCILDVYRYIIKIDIKVSNGLENCTVYILCRRSCRSGGFLAGAGADLKFDLELQPIIQVGSGSFFWQVKN